MTVHKGEKSTIERLQERQSGESDGHEDLKPKSRVRKLVPAAQRRGAPSQTQNYAELDLRSLRHRGFVTPDSGRSRIVEEFRSIKRPILSEAFQSISQNEGRNHVIMITSAHPAEGKTFVAINLAMSIAQEKGLHVLLIDADVIKRDLPGQLGFSPTRGFLDMLIDDSLGLSDIMVRTNVPNLTILPSGVREDEATELITSPAMSNLMADIATRHSDRVIIIDTPPVLLSSEAEAFADLAGQILLVVEAESTNRSDVTEAIQRIGYPEKTKLLLNKAGRQFRQAYYAAYYPQH